MKTYNVALCLIPVSIVLTLIYFNIYTFIGCIVTVYLCWSIYDGSLERRRDERLAAANLTMARDKQNKQDEIKRKNELAKIEWPKKVLRAKKILENAQEGVLTSQFELGMILLTGEGVDKDERQGLKWIRRAAAGNEPNAVFMLSEIYQSGKYGYTTDKAVAVNYLLKAAQLGHTDANEILRNQLLKRNMQSNLESSLHKLKQSAWQEYYSFESAVDMDTMTGIQFEKLVGKLYNRLGYSVQFTSTNNDQGTDIIASKGDKKISVQVKRYKSKVGNAAVQQAIAGAQFHSCTHTSVITNSSFTKSALELARRSSTEMIDGKKLIELFKKTSEETEKPFVHAKFGSLKSKLKTFSPLLSQRISEATSSIQEFKASKKANEDIDCRSLKWEYPCPLSWDDLEATETANVRHCSQCDSHVYFSDKEKKLSQLAFEGKCTATSLKFSKSPTDIHSAGEITIGLIIPTRKN